MPKAVPQWALSSSGTGVLHRIDICDDAPYTTDDGLWRALCRAATEPESADDFTGPASVCSFCATADQAVA